MRDFDFDFDDVSNHFSTKSALDLAIVRLSWIVWYGRMHIYPKASGDPPRFKPEIIELNVLSPSFQRRRALKAREFLYFFGAYSPPDGKEDQFDYLDVIRREFIAWGVYDEAFFISSGRKINRVKLNKHLSSLVQRGIIRRDVVHHTYSPGDDWLSDMRTFHELQRFIKNAPSGNVRSTNHSSIIYPLPREKIKERKGFEKFDGRSFELDVAKITRQAGSDIRESFIEHVKRNGETTKDVRRRLGIPGSMLTSVEAIDVLFDSMPVIVFDPLPRSFLPDQSNIQDPPGSARGSIKWHK